MASPKFVVLVLYIYKLIPSLTPAQLQDKLQKDALAVLKDESNAPPPW